MVAKPLCPLYKNIIKPLDRARYPELRSILHDIGAVEAQKKYGSIDGVYQEKEGPAVAKEILKKVDYNKNIDSGMESLFPVAERRG